MDGGLCRLSSARPTSTAYYPISVRRAAILLHAAFRPRLATTPLRFANPSPPSSWIRDLHPRVGNHAWQTKKPWCSPWDTRVVLSHQQRPPAHFEGCGGGFGGFICCCAGFSVTGALISSGIVAVLSSPQPIVPRQIALPRNRNINRLNICFPTNRGYVKRTTAPVVQVRPGYRLSSPMRRRTPSNQHPWTSHAPNHRQTQIERRRDDRH